MAMTWEELEKTIAQMSPAQKKFSVSIHDVSTGEEFLADEVNYEWQGKIQITERPLLLVNS